MYMTDEQRQALGKAHEYLEQTKTILSEAKDVKGYGQAAAGVTVAYKALQPFDYFTDETMDFENSLIEVSHAPGADTTQVANWTPLSNEIWNGEKVEEQVRFIEMMVQYLEKN